MIEFFISPKKALDAPLLVIAVSFLFVSFGVGLFILFPSIEGGVILLSMIPAIPLIWNLIVGEEENEEIKLEKTYGSYYSMFPEDRPSRKNYSFINYHKPLLQFFGAFFLGSLLAFTFWYIALPPEVSHNVFSPQLKEISRLRGGPVAPAVAAVTGHAFKPDYFNYLLSNNLEVLGVMFFFSLLYGMGAVYLLLWNASIIGVFIGAKIHAGGVLAVVTGFLGLIPHGSLEILAYLVGSLAGGIFSTAIMRKHYEKPGFAYIMLDVVVLTVLAVVLLVVGAFVEASY